MTTTTPASWTPSPTESPTPAATLPSVTPTPLSGIVVYPNPFNPDRAPQGMLKIAGIPACSSFYIYTLAGELVKQQTAGNGSNGTAQFDIRTVGGQGVANGAYLYVVRLGSKTLAKGLLVVRREGP